MKRARFEPMIFAAAYAFIFPTMIGCIVGWMALSDANIGIIKDWQTLIAGVIAIFAALVGGGFVYYQTAEARRQQDALLARRHAASRSVLPLALSGLVGYAERAAQALETLRPLLSASGVVGRPPMPFVVPDFDVPDVDRLKDTIESSSEDISDRIARIISDVQILDARLRWIREALTPRSSTLILEMNINDYVINAATIYARCADLFSYARRDTEDVPSVFPPAQSLLAALRQLDLDDWSHAEVFAMAEARANRLSGG